MRGARAAFSLAAPDGAATALRVLAARPSIQLIVGRVATAVSTQFSLLAVSVFVGLAARGRVSILLQAAAMIALVSGAGGPIAVGYYCARGRLTRQAVRGWFGISCAVVVAVALLVAAGRDAIGLDTLSGWGVFLALAAVAVGTTALSASTYVAVVQERTRAVLRAQLLLAAGTVASAAAFVAADGGMSEPLLVASIGCVSLIAGYTAWVAVTPWPVDPSLPPAGTRTVLAYGLRSAGGQLGLMMALRGDVLLLAFLLPTDRVGLYATALLLMEGSQLLNSAVGGLIFARLSAAPASARAAMFRLYRRKLILATVGIAAVAAALAALVERQALEGSGLFRLCLLLAPGYVLMTAAAVTDVYLSARGRPGATSFAYIAGASALIATDLALVPHWGVTGAAIGSFVGYSVAWALLASLSRRADRQGSPVGGGDGDGVLSAGAA